jgi:hypothetical protein
MKLADAVNEQQCYDKALQALAAGSHLPVARQCKLPHHCHGCRNLPRAPSPTDNEAPPSHPPPPLGGSSKLPLTKTSATASYPPSLQPFSFGSIGSTYSEGGDAHPFHHSGLTLPPRKRTQQKLHPHCVCRCHGPRAPNPQEHLLCRQQHRPCAPN